MKFDINILKEYCDKTTMCYEKHPTQNLYLFGYYSDQNPPKPTIWDSISVHCRGLILDGEGNVVERPFPKFWTYRQYLSKDTLLLSEDRIIKLPRGRFRILEKIDGTMVTLYWIGDKPFLATQRSFTNIKAIEATKLLYAKYSHLFSKLDRQFTYIFEAVYPETKVLIDYGEIRDLYLIGMINKETGELMELPDLGFPKSHDYTPEYGHLKNFDDIVALDLSNHEGFVAYFDNGVMMKLKFPWYQKAHKILDYYIHKDRVSFVRYREMADIFNFSYRKITVEDVAKTLEQGDINLLSLRWGVPEFYHLMGYDYWLNMTKEKILNHDAILKTEAGCLLNVPLSPIFDIEMRMMNPHIYETNVWKWEQRYIKH